MKRLMMPEPEPGGYIARKTRVATRRVKHATCVHGGLIITGSQEVLLHEHSVQGPEELMKGENVLIM